MKPKDAELLNGLALAYMGDAVYEQFIREYLLTKGQTKPNQLHRLATNYVSAKAQAWLIDELIAEAKLSEIELDFFKRGRNAKSYSKAKNTDGTTYNKSSGFEAVLGYLYLTQQSARLNEIINECIFRIDSTLS
ncbi:Mini-ribonuclease 3 [Marinilactibacillus psychrotolerans]|uniref:Mini-ribonuclease 3 n=2 Tax=Marinilactibacillus psychrotolerans TaxID=191770 RepID=A0A511H0C3_9LACT|nr:Mini-ribonuclease 3 [Marinilactibacillus psychrotolerans]TLQ07948.1 Mini-ribonuclease 3 [Marinilactibacillus psychrotolerans]SDC46130.1 ribonuclease-3 family protein [Marinilactibacillus psychrotolerans]SJN17144.1 COG1939: Ribonuclease III family protein [Marinilactibacillus psychrotolerans 42ea]GEL66982.1 mini-ribonuclease 3 [Marinilactibacillus psychrotolerans]GEQ34048.1 mini-ribonuclease 3 [Marinilactibacillus psychrotolerans]